MFALAFLAVGREGVETALFMVGYAEAETAWPLVGSLVGVLIAVAIAYGMYRGAVRINLAKFFTYTGAFLIVVAAGILSYGVGALQTVGWLPGLAQQGLRHQLPGSTGRPGTARSSRASSTSRPTPTWLQFVGWLAYLVVVLAIFLRPTQGAREERRIRRRPEPPPHPKGPPREHFSRPRPPSPSPRPHSGGVSLAGCQAKEETRPARPRHERHPPRSPSTRPTPRASCRAPRQHGPKHFRDHQQRHQGHGVLRLRRG